MNRRSFFQSLAAIGSGLLVAPSLFIPKQEDRFKWIPHTYRTGVDLTIDTECEGVLIVCVDNTIIHRVVIGKYNTKAMKEAIRNLPNFV